MSPGSMSVASTRSDPLYAALRGRVLARDQKGASEIYYGLVKSGRPLPEMLREAVRIHGPYTHVPYHERIDDGYVNFVNNDHCLLSARAALHLSKMVPAAAARAADGADHLVHPDRPRHLEPEDRQGARPLSRAASRCRTARRPRRSFIGPTRSRWRSTAR